MPVQGPSEFFGEVENEHLLSKELLKGDRGKILNDLGFQRDALGSYGDRALNSRFGDGQAEITRRGLRLPSTIS